MVADGGTSNSPDNKPPVSSEAEQLRRELKDLTPEQYIALKSGNKIVPTELPTKPVVSQSPSERIDLENSIRARLQRNKPQK